MPSPSQTSSSVSGRPEQVRRQLEPAAPLQEPGRERTVYLCPDLVLGSRPGPPPATPGFERRTRHPGCSFVLQETCARLGILLQPRQHFGPVPERQADRRRLALQAFGARQTARSQLRQHSGRVPRDRLTEAPVIMFTASCGPSDMVKLLMYVPLGPFGEDGNAFSVSRGGFGLELFRRDACCTTPPVGEAAVSPHPPGETSGKADVQRLASRMAPVVSPDELDAPVRADTPPSHGRRAPEELDAIRGTPGRLDRARVRRCAGA